MKNIGLFAFGVTSCVLVPTTLHLLQAGPNQVAKLIAADEESVQVGDAKVDISVDHGLVDAGGKVRVTLTATADKRTKVPLAVLVYEQAGMGEGRTENPPVRVGRDEVTLDVVDGKATKTFAFTLPGGRPATMDGMGRFGHYTVLVMPPKAADELETKRRGATNSDNDPRGFFVAYRNSDDTSTDAAGAIARLDVNTRSPSDHLAIVASDVARAGSDIAVKVHVRNPTRRAFRSVQVTLDAEASDLSGQWKGIAKEQVEIDDNPGATFAFAGHEAKDIVFHVHTGETGTLGLVASVQCDGDDCFSDMESSASAEALNDSVLDAIDILPSGSDTEGGETVGSTAPLDGALAAAQAELITLAPLPPAPATPPAATRVAQSRPASTESVK
jgi:hypothetical protein